MSSLLDRIRIIIKHTEEATQSTERQTASAIAKQLKSQGIPTYLTLAVVKAWADSNGYDVVRGRYGGLVQRRSRD